MVVVLKLTGAGQLFVTTLEAVVVQPLAAVAVTINVFTELTVAVWVFPPLGNQA
jgi:hypothetical protein